MKKKTILLVAFLALVAFPAAALAAPAPAATTGGWEFTLGGFVKLETWWDSTQMDKALNARTQRNNDPNFHHGQLRFTAQGTRFNLSIKGPKLFGASTSALIEMDFDKEGDARQAPSHSYTPRLRHAMFRLNWPETELLFGQFWSLLCEFPAETVQDGGFYLTGSPTHRLAQIRFTQKFADMFRVAFLVGVPTNTGDAIWEASQNRPVPFGVSSSLGLAGTSAETPHLQGLFAFERDLYGKAAFYGRPRGFVAQVAAAWQRTRYRNNVVGLTGNTWGHDRHNATLAAAAFQDNNQIMNNWVVQGTLFIPIIPTRTANLAGTASLSTQWFIGQGVGAFGLGNDGDNSYWVWVGPGGVFDPVNLRFTQGFYDLKLTNRYGGYVQAQYYFTNQWFLTAAYGMTKAFGVTQERNFLAPVVAGVLDRSKYLTASDQMKTLQQFLIGLWYTPITSVKFGLQYQYNRTDWFQKRMGFNQNINTFGPGNITDIGENHSVRFTALYFF
ncbi:MAG: hypothetical protein FJ128_01115 [Deltaproteobacteria bacterium]|nr:hypothetical protein [Deltaproteobacteria bacterium]